MKITAAAIGSFGDVKPFVELGKEMKRRGHSFKVAAFPRFQSYVEENGLEFAPIHGDGDLMMRLLLSECKDGLAYLNGMKQLYRKNPEMMEQSFEAAKGADLGLYILLGGFIRHAAEALQIPCVRVFFYPFDKTNQFSVQMPAMKRNTPLVGFTYTENEIGMNMVTRSLLNDWRTAHGLPKWGLFSNYRKLYGKPVPTLYAYREALVPREPKWGSHIHVTGFWQGEEQTDFQPDEKLAKFLSAGEPPVYIGFGSIVFDGMERVQKAVYDAVKKTGIRAIMSSGWMKWQTGKDDNICYVDFVPHEWLFRHVKGVVHHGGAGTSSAGLRAGCPTFVLAFGGDQLFWGLQIAERNLGPAPVDIHSGKWTQEQIEHGLLALKNDVYSDSARHFGETLRQENGCKNAADVLESLI